MGTPILLILSHGYIKIHTNIERINTFPGKRCLKIHQRLLSYTNATQMEVMATQRLAKLCNFIKKHRIAIINILGIVIGRKMVMNIVVISQRDDNYCYDLAAKLYDKYGDDIFNDIFEDFN